jgi:hypothetical protein
MSTPITTQALAQRGEIFESVEDGFRLQVPQGWVIQTYDLTELPRDDDDLSEPPDVIYEPLTILCLENESLPTIGGGRNCLGGNLTDSIFINRFSDLQTMPAFHNESDSTVITPTTDDLVALRIETIRNTSSASEIRIENTTDINEFTKIVDMTYHAVEPGDTILPFDNTSYDVKSKALYVLSQDRNTGYYIGNNLIFPNPMNVTEHSPAVQEVFGTFELVS